MHVQSGIGQLSAVAQMSTSVHPNVSVQRSPGDGHGSPATWPCSRLQSERVGPASLQIDGTHPLRHVKDCSGGKQLTRAHGGSHPMP
jgi:hypothetical protein